MDETEIINLLNAAVKQPETREQVWETIVANAYGNADQLSLPDRLKLDGVVELLRHIYTQILEHTPIILPSYTPFFHAACSGRRTTQCLDTQFDWSHIRVAPVHQALAESDAGIRDGADRSTAPKDRKRGAATSLRQAAATQSKAQQKRPSRVDAAADGGR